MRSCGSTNPRFAHLKVMGDNGAFSYRDAEVPPFTVDDVIDFYERCGFDLGISVDHVILAFDASFDTGTQVPQAYRDRQQVTPGIRIRLLPKNEWRKSAI